MSSPSRFSTSRIGRGLQCAPRTDLGAVFWGWMIPTMHAAVRTSATRRTAGLKTKRVSSPIGTSGNGERVHNSLEKHKLGPAAHGRCPSGQVNRQADELAGL